MTVTFDPAVLAADLGFLVRWDIPTADHDAVLVVALRETPTHRHFDPERIEYWRTGADGRGQRAELTFASTMTGMIEFSWGPIEIVDRLGISNTFVSLGGTITAERDRAETAFVTLRSSGPILRRGGHSQRYDAVAAALSSFFGRLLVPIDYQAGAERRINATTPIVRYAAFLRHEVPRLSSELVRQFYGPDGRLVLAEAGRVRARDPEAWRAGGDLLARLGLAAGRA